MPMSLWRARVALMSSLAVMSVGPPACAADQPDDESAATVRYALPTIHLAEQDAAFADGGWRFRRGAFDASLFLSALGQRDRVPLADGRAITNDTVTYGIGVDGKLKWKWSLWTIVDWPSGRERTVQDANPRPLLFTSSPTGRPRETLPRSPSM